MGTNGHVCRTSKIPVALDEELIGAYEEGNHKTMLGKIRPAYLILKPSLLGGFERCNQWVESARKEHIGYWITSALESNIGLNAIAQYTSSLPSLIPQGLGTGKLYTNNFDSPLETEAGFLYYRRHKQWNVQLSRRNEELP